MNNSAFLGVVEGGRFRVLESDPGVTGYFRLTSIQMQAAETPEGGEVDLSTYEGSALLVRGVESGEWIYSAVVVEQAGPILSAVARRAFGLPSGRQAPRLKT